MHGGGPLGLTEPEREPPAPAKDETAYTIIVTAGQWDSGPVDTGPAAVGDQYIDLSVPSTSSVKRWMDWRAVTDETSLQWALIHEARIEPDGLMTIDGYYLAALGPAYGPVGTRYLVTIGDQTVGIIKADEKQIAHTAGGSGYTGLDGHILEMIVDADTLDAEAMYSGDCNCLLPGDVTAIKKEKNQ